MPGSILESAEAPSAWTMAGRTAAPAEGSVSRISAIVASGGSAGVALEPGHLHELFGVVGYFVVRLTKARNAALAQATHT